MMNDRELAESIFDEETQHIAEVYDATAADIELTQSRLESLPPDRLAAVLTAVGVAVDNKEGGAAIVAGLAKVMNDPVVRAALLGLLI